MDRLRIVLLLALASCTASWAQAVPVKIYAQELVDATLAKHPELSVMVMHVTPPNGERNIVIASNIGRIGKPGDEDDLRVIETGKPNVEIGHGGKRFEVELVLRDAAGETIGALGLVWPYRAGQDKATFERQAEAIRDALARRILNAANLMDPYPFEPLATTRTHAQRLVDEMQQRHPEVTVLALRGRAAEGGDLVVLGSTFGRHGKKADADDLKILAATAPATGIYSKGKRFGADLPLRDASGKTVGTMNVGYAYKEGDDRGELLGKAESLRDEIQKRIASADRLGELDP